MTLLGSFVWTSGQGKEKRGEEREKIIMPAPLSSTAVDTAVYDIIKDDESGNFTNHPSMFSAARNGVVKLL